jgi:tetratricopeptide (TPR) repeat protein
MSDHDITATCLSTSTIAQWMELRLPKRQRDLAETHLDRCEMCRVLLVEASHELVRSTAATGQPTEVRAVASDGEVIDAGTIVGRYVVQGVLGAGGMGVVYAAYDPELDRTVAIKLLRTPARSERSREASTQLHGEAQAMARIRHANVVTVYEVGVFRDQVFIAMERVDGTTLRDWMSERPRNWREVVAMFLLAGEGLAAAHDVGVVHRDFKPENVLVRRDGEVRVSDFGLSAFGHDEPTHASVGGTPAYMAPEWMHASSGDPRGDQFSFGVAFYEALYGTRPFSDHNFGERLEPARRAIPNATNARVPRAVRAVLHRALAVDVESRYRSMGELLAHLRRGLRTRRMVGGAVAVTAMVGLAIVTTVAITSRTARSSSPCATVADRLSDVWNDARRDRAKTAFLATKAPYAPVSFDHASAELGRYTTAWAAMRLDACEATEVRHEQSSALRDRRIGCLDEAAVRVQVIADAFVNADLATARDAITLVEGLPPLATCNDTKSLLAVVPPPTDPVTRARADAFATKIAIANALFVAGKLDAASEQLDGLDAEVGAIGYAPLTTSLLLVRARLAASGPHVADAQPLFRRAALEAEASGKDELKADALLGLTWFQKDKDDSRDAERAFEEASAISRRLGSPKTLEAEIASHRGASAEAGGDFRAALPWRRRAVVLMTEQYGDDDVRVAKASLHLAETLRHLASFQEANTLADHAVGVLDTTLGADHPDAATAHVTRAVLRFEAGHVEDALAEATDANRRLVATLGHDNPALARSMMVIATAQAALEHYDVAISLFRRAVALTEPVYGATEAGVRADRLALAQALINAGRRDEALSEYNNVIAASERTGDGDGVLVGNAELGIANILVVEGKQRAAIPRFQRAVAIFQARLGARDPQVGMAISQLGSATASFDPSRGLELLEQGVAIEVAALGTEDVHTATDRSTLGQLLYESGRDRERGRRIVVQVRDQLAKLGAEADLADVDTWLRRHPEPASRRL